MATNQNLPIRLDEEIDLDAEEEEQDLLDEDEEDELKPVKIPQPVSPAQMAARKQNFRGRPRKDTMPQLPPSVTAEQPVAKTPKFMQADEPKPKAIKREAEPISDIKKADKKYIVFYQQERAGILDNEKQEVINEVPREFLWIADILSDIKNDIEEIKDLIGKV